MRCDLLSLLLEKTQSMHILLQSKDFVQLAASRIKYNQSQSWGLVHAASKI